MMAKINFTYLIIGHLIGIVLLVIALFFSERDYRFILQVILAALAGSMVVQLILYRKNPGSFNDKTKKDPNLP